MVVTIGVALRFYRSVSWPEERDEWRIVAHRLERRIGMPADVERSTALQCLSKGAHCIFLSPERTINPSLLRERRPEVVLLLRRRVPQGELTERFGAVAAHDIELPRQFRRQLCRPR